MYAEAIKIKVRYVPLFFLRTLKLLNFDITVSKQSSDHYSNHSRNLKRFSASTKPTFCLTEATISLLLMQRTGNSLSLNTTALSNSKHGTSKQVEHGIPYCLEELAE